MLCTKQKVLRRFWYATLPVDKLAAGPRAFTLLGEDIMLFLDGNGEPAALRNRCCHRTAKLSKGWCKDGHVICGYHGWEYDRTGKLVKIPQFRPTSRSPMSRSGRSIARNAMVMPGSPSTTRCCRSPMSRRTACPASAVSISSTTAGTPARCA
jgi:nitrite reductase/ring-hydroxylating ferredoxin subunit